MVRHIDIIVAAQRVLKECVPQSKMGLAGLTFIGDKDSYVAVNGLKRGFNGAGSEDGNRANTTSTATGTAVKIPLSTRVSGLVQGNGLDEDGKLNVS